MAKYAEITYARTRIVKPSVDNSSPVSLDDNPANQFLGNEVQNNYQRFADVYIEVRDENGTKVPGNYATVNYQEYYDGVPGPIGTATLIGLKTKLFSDALLYEAGQDFVYTFDVIIVGNVIENNGAYVPPGVCDATINSIVIDKKESNTGSNNGQITINASTSAGPLEYRLNTGDYQPGATFNNLAGGGYTATVRDARGCIVAQNFSLPSVANLLLSDPTVNLGNGNISRWSAAFNPVVFTYQRRDFGISLIYADASHNATFIVNGALGAGAVILAADDWVYINAGAYNGVYKVLSVNLGSSTITINMSYMASTVTGGYININKLRPYYQVRTQITYQDKITGQVETIKATHRPNSSGLVKADVSSFLQSLLRAKDDSDNTQVNYRDDNLSASYTVSYAEVWQNVATGTDTEPAYINIPQPYYALYAARQLGDAHGGNMAAFVPFKSVDGASKRARWITDFAEPAYSAGYPFDIGFIYSEDLAGQNVYCEITPLDINRQPLPDSVENTYLLNEDSSFLLNQDNSKLVIFRQPVTNEPITQSIAQHIGLNRLRINTAFNNRVHYFNIELKYADAGNTIHTVTQTQTIRVDTAGNLQSVYLRWIGLTGSWNYYRFVHNQEVTLDVQNAVIVKNHIIDWANQDAMEDVISKSAGVKMKVMAEDLSVADIKGLQSIKYSPKVQMLVSNNPIKWQTVVLNTATFAEYETRNGQAPFSITFNLPGLNIQTQ
ncbi:hypothetical protein ACFQ3S_02835 [Mucilaginibacter terrae]|uniref:hypothetical protein n=1 Tax=Mucilaginibacter terrae TaxID=1955052 RepID=UPI00362CE4AD